MMDTSKNTEQEIWKPIIGYEGLYEISNDGSARSMDRVVRYKLTKRKRKGVILKKRLDKDGYIIYMLCKEGMCINKKAHRLVGSHFIENENNHPIINHIDSVRSNNHYQNLEWTTYLGNSRHAVLANRRPRFTGEQNAMSKINNEIANEIRVLRRSKVKIKELCSIFNISKSTINRVIGNKCWN